MKKSEFSNYVESHAEKIKLVISQIKELDGKSEDVIRQRLDEMYPSNNKSLLTEELTQEIINSMIKII